MGGLSLRRSRLKARSADTSDLPDYQLPDSNEYLSSYMDMTTTPSDFSDGGMPQEIHPSSQAGQGVLIGLLSAFGSAALVALVFGIIYFFRYTIQGRILLDRFGRPGEYDDDQARAKEEAEALERMDEISRLEYFRAKAFVEANPPESVPTDISLSQFLAIQEKGVSAWEFEAELEIANCFVEQRTEVEFFDSICSVQSNLPVPKQNEVYYWEAKLYDKPENTLVSIGMTTKPYPMFRLPGWHRHSIAYTSTGHRRHNQPFNGIPYGPAFVQGDVIGVGYRPRTGTVFFTRNGKKLDDVAHGLKSFNLFPTLGANGPASVHVNFGQLGFVFIEANVKKWGLAPMTGSLAPPPPYGSEQGSILLETGQRGSPMTYFDNQQHADNHYNGRVRAGTTLPARHVLQSPTSPGPPRSPNEISLTHIDIGESSSQHQHQHLNNTSILHNDPNNQLNIHIRGLSPPPDYSSQTSSNDTDSLESMDPQTRRRAERAAECERLLGHRSPTPAYKDIVRERSPGGRSRSESAPAAGQSSSNLSGS